MVNNSSNKIHRTLGPPFSRVLYLQRLLEVEEVLPLRVSEHRVVDVSPEVDLRRAAHGLAVVRSVLQGASKCDDCASKRLPEAAAADKDMSSELGMALLITQIFGGSFDATHAVYARLQHSHVKGYKCQKR